MFATGHGLPKMIMKVIIYPAYFFLIIYQSSKMIKKLSQGILVNLRPTRSLDKTASNGPPVPSNSARPAPPGI
jgi:hypothetical protein